MGRDDASVHSHIRKKLHFSATIIANLKLNFLRCVQLAKTIPNFMRCIFFIMVITET